MNIVNVENITKSYTGRKLFSKASFYVQEYEKIGIIGINGTGKSTLLKIIAGLEEADEGTVTKANNIVIGYLPQNPDYDPDKTVMDQVMSQLVLSNLDHDMRWSLESEAKSLLTRFGINDFKQPTGQLSGGQRKRLALVAAVLKPCDVLIMDEPTNHLDYEMVEWLESYLRGFKGAIIMVTHDRYFLDSVCNRIVEIDKGNTYSYDTNYCGFLERKAAREDSQRASERKRQSILRKEIEWMQRGARARSTKQKAHIQRYEALRDQKGPQIADKLELSSISTRMGRTTIELHNISKSYENTVCVKDFTYIFLKKDRIGFVGKNGCGKTTLMKMIAGELEPDSGNIEIGATIKIGYYGQEIEMPENDRVIDYIKDEAEYVRTVDGLVSASAMLERFLFPPEQQYSPVSKLSGGEKRRLHLLRVLMSAPNVLILDEPTNDLDTESMTILEDYLDGYDGIVITVSHDRYFLDRIARRIFAFEDGGVLTQYEGGYTDYMHKRPQQLESMTKSSAKSMGQGNDDSAQEKDSKATWGHQKKLKFTYKEQKEYETIEQDIEDLEAKIEELDRQMHENSTNYSKLSSITQEKDEMEILLMEKMERWEYLEDLAQKINNQ
ncbi:MAG: ABC-F family ATP-binding cassette domain-containing protein [Agathobacter sp.]|nr:ABC-F family ATP-binding cassette domain-containing protein [Agathobacter sp.]